MLRRLLTTLLAVSMLLSSPSPALLAIPAPVMQDASTPTTAEVLFRTTVTLRQPTDRARLDQLGVVVLSQTSEVLKTSEVYAPAYAVVLVDADQLETLARLRFEPTASDEVGALVTANASIQPGLAESLQPLLAQAKAVQFALAKANAATQADAYTPLRAAMRSLSPQQAAALASLSTLDDDGDGRARV